MAKLSIILIAVILLLISCNNNSKKQYNNKQDKLEEYFSNNKWDYPFDLNTSALLDSAKIKNISISNLELIINQLKNFCFSDSIKNKNDSAVRVSEFSIKKTKGNDSIFNLACRIDFYRIGRKFINGSVMPIEGHGIIENKFLISKNMDSLK